MTSFLKSIELHQPHLDEKITWVHAIHAWHAVTSRRYNMYRPETLHTTWCRGPGHQQTMYQWSAQALDHAWWYVGALDLVICWGPGPGDMLGSCSDLWSFYYIIYYFATHFCSVCFSVTNCWLVELGALMHIYHTQNLHEAVQGHQVVLSSCLNSKTRPIATQGGSLATYSHWHSLMSLSPHARVVSFEQLIKGTNSTSPCTRPRVFLLRFWKQNPARPWKQLRGRGILRAQPIFCTLCVRKIGWARDPQSWGLYCSS